MTQIDATYLASLGAGVATCGLSSRAMLVDLTIKKWSNTRQDRRVSDDVAVSHGNDRKMGKFSKHLIDPAYLEPLTSKLGAIYLEHRRRTLPWLDSGPRILSAAGYFDYTLYMREASRELDELLDNPGSGFVANYLLYVSDAARKLNGLFEPMLYPAHGKIREHFGMEYRVLPMPDAGDFRVELGDAETERIRQQISGAAASALELATKDVYDRITEHVGKMAQKLTGYTGGKEGAFRDSLVSNVRDLVDVLPSLNLTGSPELDDLTGRIRRELCPVDPDILRKDEATRVQVAQSAESILDQMSAFVA